MNTRSDEKSRLRTRNLIFGLGFGIISRAIAAVVQIVAIPMAVVYLGVDGYAVYAALSAAALFPVTLIIRYGPSFVVEAAEAFGFGNDTKLNRVMWSASLPIFLNTLLVFLAICLVLGWIPASSLIAESQANAAYPTTLIFVWLVAFALLGSAFHPLEETQSALQENYLLSVRSIFANLASGIALVLVVPRYPSLLMLVLAIHLPLLVARGLNTLFFFARRPNLLPNTQSVHWQDVSRFTRQGLAFTALTAIMIYLCNQFPVVVAGKYLDAKNAAVVACTMQLIIQGYSVAALLITPLIPAVADAIARSDRGWARKAILRSLLLLVAYGGVMGIAFAVLGPLVVRWLLKLESIDPTIVWSAACYMPLMVIESFLFLILISKGKSTSVYVLFAIKSFLMAAMSVVGSQLHHPSWIFWGGALATLFVTVIPYLRNLTNLFAHFHPTFLPDAVSSEVAENPSSASLNR